MLQEFVSPIYSNDEYKEESNEEEISFYIERKAMKYEICTGLSNLKPAFKRQMESSIDIPDVDALANFLVDKFYRSNYDINLYEFMIRNVRFSEKFLKFVGADNEEFYDHLSFNDAILIILRKAFETYYDIPASNGFPAEFNFVPSDANTLNNTRYGIPWFPYKGSNNNYAYTIALDHIRDLLDRQNDKLYFHGKPQ